LGQFQRAQELYQEALARQGSNRALQNNWCFSFYLQGDLAKAESCFKEALARDSGNAAARNNLGLLWCRQGKLAEAQRLWEETEGTGAAQNRLNQALAFLGMSPPAHYAKAAAPKSAPPPQAAALPKPAASVIPASPAKPVVAAAKPPVKAPAQPVAAPPKAKLQVAAKAPESKPASPTLAAASPKPAVPVIPASPAKPVVAAAKTPVKAPAPAQPVAAPPKAELQVAAKAPEPKPAPPPQAAAPSKPAVPVIPASPAKPVVAEAKAPVKAPAPAQPVAVPPKAELQVAAKAPEPKSAPPPQAAAPQKPAVPVIPASPAKPVVAEAKAPVKASAPAQPMAVPPKAELPPAAKPATRPVPLTVAEREAGIEVRNGTRTKNLARFTRALLSQEGFKVTQIGNHIDFGAEATVIYYRAGAERLAQALNSEIFPEAKLEQSARLKKGVAIRVLLGHDLLDQPQIMARLTGEEMGASLPAVNAKGSAVRPQPQSVASKAPAAPVIVADPAQAGPAKPQIQAAPLAARPTAKNQASFETATPKGPLTAAELMATLIEIRNGTRSQNLAHRARSLLSREGFSVGIIGNHIDFGAGTTVIYYRAGAEKVARALNSEIFPGAQLTPSSRLNKGMAIKVVLGRDLLDRPQLMSRLAEE